jgi:hypothetical protein
VPAIVFCGDAGEQTGLSMRGTCDAASDGNPWDLMPDSIMANATAGQ